MHIWDGSAWSDGGSIQGPKGSQGDAGPKGDTGADSTVAGPKGDAGTPGSDGNDGTPGAKGETGQKGDTGAPGNDSTVAGPKGDAGQKGAQGEPGEKGATGDKGDTGADSTVAGPKGNTGDAGAPGTPGSDGDKGEPGNDGAGVPAGGTTGQALLKQSNTDQDVYWGTVAASGSATNSYCIRAEFNSSQNLAGAEFIAPSGAGFETAGGTIGTISGQNLDLQFNEAQPPKSIMVYAYKGNGSEYVVTHLDGGGNNANYFISGTTQSAHTSSHGISNQVTTDLFTNFSAATLKIDLSSVNFDWNRNPGGFTGSVVEAHLFIVVKF